jgi:ceramide glucosyltransferase
MALFWVFAAITIVGLIAYVFQIWAVRATCSERLNCFNGSNGSYPHISILKPLKGLDDNLFDNLESFCNLDYPEYEIVFSLQDYNDPAYKIAKKIKDRHSDKDITILVSRCNDGLNPKVNNLISAYKIAKYETILISDSNVMVEPDYLKSITAHMQDNSVGLVSNIITGTDGRTLGSVFENLHLNSFILGSVCFLDKFLKMPCVVGKSMLMRKSDLEAIGGFKAVKDVLAEDYVIGRRMHESGKRVVLSSHAIKNVNEYWSFKRFLNRHTRWGKLRWRLGGAKYISELIGNPVFMSVMPLIFMGISHLTVCFALTIAMLKATGDMYLTKKANASMHPVVYLLAPLKDIVIGLIWFVPLLSNIVIWRGNRYIIGKETLLQPCPEIGVWSWKYRLVDAIRTKFA